MMLGLSRRALGPALIRPLYQRGVMAASGNTFRTTIPTVWSNGVRGFASMPPAKPSNSLTPVNDSVEKFTQKVSTTGLLPACKSKIAEVTNKSAIFEISVGVVVAQYKQIFLSLMRNIFQSFRPLLITVIMGNMLKMAAFLMQFPISFYSIFFFEVFYGMAQLAISFVFVCFFHNNMSLQTRTLMVCIIANRGDAAVVGGGLGKPPFILPTLAMDPPDCINRSLWYPVPSENCYFVRMNGTLVNPGLLIQSPLYPNTRPWPASLELFVVLTTTSPTPVDIGAFGQGSTPFKLDLQDGITVEVLYHIPVFWRLRNGTKTKDGFEMEFPVYLNATVTVPNMGQVVTGQAKQSALAFVSTTGGPHLLLSGVLVEGTAGTLSAKVSMFVEMSSITLIHWHFVSRMNIDINGSKDGLRFQYKKEIPLFNKSL
ncbi:hypothetical protein FOL46_005897 [Perkinsus olseni]|uniref:Uncharacterized protein n=1 Tax=Perkinsus olseni TaxID=32597 RepID=A0A7J6LP58_PEROL|nr:hypothetical protein FOL46_005897 [Perkinsus olseni]